MANEITLSASLAYSEGDVAASLAFTGLQFDVTGNKVVHTVQSVAITTDEPLVHGDVGTPGYIIIKNHDDANFVSLSDADGTTACVKIKAGEVAMFRLASADPYIVADTAACIVEYLLIED